MAVELIDRHHARLFAHNTVWLADIGPGADQDWFAITVFADSLLCSAGARSEAETERALDWLVAGLRAMRVRVTIERALRRADV